MRKAFFRKITFTSKSLSLNVFLLITLFLLVPVYISIIILKGSYEAYIQRELNSQIVSTIQKGENEFNQTFEKMAVISNMFALDNDLLDLLTDDSSSYWDRNKRFDELVNTITINNLFNLDGIKITMFDNQRRNYANWSLFFNDYSFLLEEEWISDSQVFKGHITWNLFTPSFVIGENEKYISLSRSILNPAYIGERVATIIISVNEMFINNLLISNDAGADFIRVCTTDTVDDILSINRINFQRSIDLKDLLEKMRKTESNSLVCNVDGKAYLLTLYTINSPWMPERQELAVLYFSDYQHITERLNTLSLSINAGMILFIIMLLGIVVFISHNIARPIKLLSGRVNEFTGTREIKPLTINRNDEIGELGNAFVEMEIKINDLFDRLRRESEIREQYRFKALRAQVNPHFLFNTLNTVRWMAMIRGQENIVDTIDALSRILDYSMGRTGEMAALREELEMIQSYVHIQNYRYGEDLEIKINTEKGIENYGIIKFILQPAVENSFIHAFRKIKGKKSLLIDADIENGKLKIRIRDNGSGIDSEKLAELQRSLCGGGQPDDSEKRTGIGLLSVQQRICSEYNRTDPDGGFGIVPESGPDGTVVIYTLPLIETMHNAAGSQGES